MSATGLAAFDSTLQTTHVWLNDIGDELGWGHDTARTAQALRVVLHTLRDHLHPNEAAGLAAQLPMLVRGLFYEGWHPAGKPLRCHTAEQFLAPVAASYRGDPAVVEPTDVARAVFRVLIRHVSAGEIRDIIAVLPDDVRSLWA